MSTFPKALRFESTQALPRGSRIPVPSTETSDLPTLPSNEPPSPQQKSHQSTSGFRYHTPHRDHYPGQSDAGHTPHPKSIRHGSQSPEAMQAEIFRLREIIKMLRERLSLIDGLTENLEWEGRLLDDGTDA